MGSVHDDSARPAPFSSDEAAPAAGAEAARSKKRKRGGGDDVEHRTEAAAAPAIAAEATDQPPAKRHKVTVGKPEKAERVVQKLDISPDAFVQACRTGPASLVQELLDNGADVNARDKYTETALVEACRNGKVEIVRLLLQRGADVKAKVYGSTAVDRVYDQEQVNTALMDLLLPTAESLEERHEYGGRTWLLRACNDGKLEVIRWLIQRGANLEAKDDYGETALYWACFFGKAAVVELLLEKGANRAEKYFGRTLLMLACDNEKSDVIDVLIRRGANLEEKSNYGTTALMQACDAGKSDVIERLIRSGANLETKDEFGSTALMHACDSGKLDVIELLIRKGASLTTTDNNGDTVLLRACRSGKQDVIDRLLRMGANLEEQDAEGWRPLMYACEDGKVGLARYLIGKGANIEAKNKLGQTALMIACREDEGQTVSLLLKSGALLNVQDDTGRTAVMHACKYAKADSVRALVKKGAALDLQDKKGKTALMLACLTGKIENVRELLKRNVNLELRDSSGMTAMRFALHSGKFEFALHSGKFEIVKLLFEKGADLGGRKTFMLAWATNQAEVIRVLREQGVDTRAPDLSNATDCALIISSFCDYLLARSKSNRPATVQTEKMRAVLSTIINQQLKSLETEEQLDSLRQQLTQISKSDPDDLMTYEPARLEELFCLISTMPQRASPYFDRAKELMRQIGEHAYKQKIEELKRKFPRNISEINDFDFSIRNDINTSHYLQGVQKVEMPEALPPNVQVEDLLTFFDEINFYDPAKPQYFNPHILLADDFKKSIAEVWDPIIARQDISDAEKEALKQDALKKVLRSSLEQLVGRIVKEEDYTAVPKEEVARKKFYKYIKSGFTHVIARLNQEQHRPDSHILRCNFILGCLRASAHCAQPVLDHAIASYSTHVLKKPFDFVSAVYKELGLYREYLFGSVLTPDTEESIAYKDALLVTIGEEFGVPGYQEFKESGVHAPIEWANPERDRLRFLGLYTPQAVFHWINDHVHERADMKEACAKWFTDKFFPADYKKAEFEPQRQHANAKVTQMWQAKPRATLDAIVEALNDDPEIPDCSVNVPAEMNRAIDAALERASDAVKVRVSRLRNPPQGSRAILDTLALDQGIPVEAVKMEALSELIRTKDRAIQEKFLVLKNEGKPAEKIEEELKELFGAQFGSSIDFQFLILQRLDQKSGIGLEDAKMHTLVTAANDDRTRERIRALKQAGKSADQIEKEVGIAIDFKFRKVFDEVVKRLPGALKSEVDTWKKGAVSAAKIAEILGREYGIVIDTDKVKQAAIERAIGEAYGDEARKKAFLEEFFYQPNSLTIRPDAIVRLLQELHIVEPMQKVEKAVLSREAKEARLQITKAQHQPFVSALREMTAKTEMMPKRGGAGDREMDAILYRTLIDDLRREDVLILRYRPGNMDIPAQIPDHIRYVVSGCFVDNKHAVSVVIDREKQQYYYFDPLDGEHEEEVLKHFSALIKDQGYHKGILQSTKQRDVQKEWSCVYHAVENIVTAVTGNRRFAGVAVDGAVLEARYKKYFSEFARTYGLEEGALRNGSSERASAEANEEAPEGAADAESESDSDSDSGSGSDSD